MRIPCAKCGRVDPKTCSTPGCPYFSSRPRTLKKDFFGATPSIFVGRYGYPDVRVGMLATEEYAGNDDPKRWSFENTPIPDIIDKRSALVNSQFMANVRSFNDRFLEQSQLVVQGEKPADVEVSLDKTPSFSISYPPGAVPHGASVKLLQSRLTENVKIPKAIDKAVSDPELKASTALQELYGEVDEYHMTKLLTGGVIGRKVDRKLVPTRWAITATDDTVGKMLLEKLRDQQQLTEMFVYFGGHYGNYFCIMLFPRLWQYELFEFMAGSRKAAFTSDYEGFAGRTQYAKETAGGYYAARLPIIEHLLGMRRQAAVLCLRFITDEYTNPLGVWVVREAVRKALETKPLRFGDEELALQYAAARCKKFGIDWDDVVKQSLLLGSFKQRTLGDF